MKELKTMKGNKILIVEDEIDIQQLISYQLKNKGFETITASNGEEGLKLVKEEKPDLILLDIMLPGMDGRQVCVCLKQDHSAKAIPIIILTAKTEIDDEVFGLNLGADDYISKPFNHHILIARIQNVLRRSRESENLVLNNKEIFTQGKLYVNRKRHEVLLGDQTLNLTPTEFKILYFLAQDPGTVYSRQQILEAIQEGNVYLTERTIDVHVYALRQKLGECEEKIETIRGIGYRFRDND